MSIHTPPPRLPLWPCLAILATGLAVIPWDGPISTWVTSIKLGGDVKRELEVAQQFGDLLSIALVATLIWLLDPARRRVLWLGAASLAFAGIIGTAAKNLVGRPRPKYDDPSFLGPWGTYDLGESGGVRHAWEFWRGHWADLTSMPSSHTLFAAALAAFLAFAYPRLRRLVIVLVAVVGLARVVLRSHYPSDVLVGGALGWFAGTLGMLLAHRWKASRLPVEIGEAQGKPTCPLANTLGA